MSLLPERREQIRLVHAAFIRQVAELCQRPEQHADLTALLGAAEQQGWTALVTVLRRIARGDRSAELLAGLDEEDQVIADAVLRGLQDPSSLPDPRQAQDPTLAAPGLAHMIHAARSNPQALVLIGNMADQMSSVGGQMAKLAGVIRPLINGERDADRLSRGLDTQTQQLVRDILAELGKLDAH